jgi:uroporphyrinogen decarboxylase
MSLTLPLPRVILQKDTTRTPVWFMRQAGRYLPEYRALREQYRDFWTRCFTPEVAAEITLQPLRRFDLDAAIIFSDILTVPWALGQHVRFEAGEGPKLSPLTHGNDLVFLKPEGALQRLAPVYAALRLVREQLDPAKSLIGFAGAPWTVATYMIEGGGSRTFSRAFRWLYEDPASFNTLMELLARITADHLIAQVRAGADTVQIFDTWAGVLPEVPFRDVCIRPTRAIVDAVRAACPGVPIIGFPKGAGAKLATYAQDTGVDAVGLDPMTPLQWARDTLCGTVALQGNLDPLLLVAGGPALDTAVDRILGAFADVPHVFNLGHGIVPETPVAHVAQVLERVRQYRQN